MTDLNAVYGAEAFLERVHLWKLDLLWPAKTPAEQVGAIARLDSVLSSRGIVAAVQGAMRVPLGLRTSLVVAVEDDRVLLHDDAGTLRGGMDPDGLIPALSQHTGAWVFEPDEDGMELLEGDAEAFEREIADALGREGEDVDPVSPRALGAVHFGEPDESLWSVALKQVGGRIRLHREVALIEGEPIAALAVVQSSSGSGAALTVIDFGGWCALSYYSRDAMGTKVSSRREREETFIASAGLGATLYPSAESGTAAHRLATVLADAAFLSSDDDVAALETAMSPLRAGQAVASLRRCVPDGRIARTTVENAGWLGELCDAVELLGFDPQWVRVGFGASPEPDGGIEVQPKGVIAATVAAAKADLAAENAAEVQRQQNATGASKLIWARSWKPSTRYVVAIIELAIAALFFFLTPIPLGWVNYVVATLFTIDGVWQVADTARLEDRAARSARDARTTGPDEPQ